MKNRKKTTIILVLIILVIGVIFLAYKNGKKVYKEEINRNKMFAIMIEKGDGKYIEYRSKKWPEYGYKYNKEKTKCVDRDRKDIGNIIEYDARINEATMKSRRSAYCTLYFDIDNEPPQPGDIYIGKNENQEYTNNRNEEIHIKIDDDNATEYCLVNEKDSSKCEWKAIPELDESNWFVTTEHTLTEGDGTKEVYLYLKDEAKNISEEKEASIILDQTEPECRIDGESTTWIKGNRTITWGCSDNGSGCIEEKVNVGSYEYTQTAKQVTIMDYEIEDKAGNKKECNGVKANVYIDKTAPSKPTTMEFSYSDWSRYTQGTWTKLKIYAANTKTSKGPSGATDAHSQVAKYQISKDNNNWVDYSYSSSKEMYYMDTSGINTRYFRACDTVGNCGESISRIAKIDKDAPSCSISISGTNFVATYSDTGGSLVNSSSSSSTTQEITSAGTYTFTVYDNATNSGSCSATVTNKQSTGYTCKKNYDACDSSDGWEYRESGGCIRYGCWAYQYVWNCTQAGVSGSKFKYTSYNSNPDPSHCGYHSYSCSSCPTGYTPYGTYCYQTGGYSACSSGTKTNGACYLYNQTSCLTGWENVGGSGSACSSEYTEVGDYCYKID